MDLKLINAILLLLILKLQKRRKCIFFQRMKDTSHAKAFKAFMFLIVPLSVMNGNFVPPTNLLVTQDTNTCLHQN